MIALDRARLEVDRALRSRAFFARALAGYLEAPEYVDLVAQLGGLARVAGGVRADDLLARQRHDLNQLPAPSEGWLPRRCPTLDLLNGVCEGWRGLLSPEERWVASIGILGTSWTLEATGRLSIRFPGATAFLEELGALGPMCVQRYARRGAGTRQPHVAAAADLVRGGLLGIASYLDNVWPAPTSLITTCSV